MFTPLKKLLCETNPDLCDCSTTTSSIAIAKIKGSRNITIKARVNGKWKIISLYTKCKIIICAAMIRMLSASILLYYRSDKLYVKLYEVALRDRALQLSEAFIVNFSG